MKYKFVKLSIFSFIILLIATTSAFAQDPITVANGKLGTAFTYQGRLSQGNDPATGTFDFEFYLFDALDGGNQVGGPNSINDLNLTDGYFTVQLDFGADTFYGQARYLEVRVRPSAESGNFTILIPRQELSATPNALYSLSAPWSGLTGIPTGFADGIDNDTLFYPGSGLTLSGTTFSADTSILQARVSGVCGAGYAIRSVNADGTVTCEPVGGSAGWFLTGNAGTTPGTNYIGTSDNVALELKVNALRVLRLEPNTTSPNLIGGFSGNWLTGGVYGATICGGGALSEANRVTDDYGTVSGGGNNQAGDTDDINDNSMYATVSGGDSNYAWAGSSTVGGGFSNHASGIFSTISGGSNNYASDTNATVGGGDSNDASGYKSTISGGYGNTASSDFTTVSGGDGNTASEYYSTISGGIQNSANGWFSNISGGQHNIAVDEGDSVSGGGNNNVAGGYSIVGGGQFNNIDGHDSTISGGNYNSINGLFSTICGGRYNNVSADYTTISGGGPSDPNNPSTTNNLVTDNYGTIGGGGNNQAGDNAGDPWAAQYATVSGGSSNAASAGYSTIGGGNINNASGWGSTIGGGMVNTASVDFATIGGGQNNTASAGFATIAGGGPSDLFNPTTTNNRVTDNYGTIGGGGNNQAGDNAGTIDDAIYATIGGGNGNIASSGYATIGGGRINLASGYHSTVGGGESNEATGHRSTVGGGLDNIASGLYATVPGGSNNTAQGTSSFAAGNQAKANNAGCFVWGDSTAADLTCSNNNRWIARASGGVYFYTNSGLTSGMYLATGGSSWNAVSNPVLKEHFSAIDTQTLVENLAGIPITTWNYKSQDDNIRHIGPMAGDFNSLLSGLGGEGEMYINSLDADGIALASIQGLYQIIQEKDNHITQLEARVAALETAHETSTSTSTQTRFNLNTWLPGLFGLLGVTAGVLISRKRGGNL